MKSVSRRRARLFLWLAALLGMVIWACNLGTEKSRSEFSFKSLADSLSKFDKVVIVVRDTLGNVIDTVFKGPVRSAVDLEGLPAPHYHGEKVDILIVGYDVKGEEVFRVEKRFDGSTGKTDPADILLLPGTQVRINSPGITLLVGMELALPSVTVTPSELTDKRVRWSSSDAALLVDSGNGHFWGKKSGRAYLRARYGVDTTKVDSVAVQVADSLVNHSPWLHFSGSDSGKTAFNALEGSTLSFRVVGHDTDFTDSATLLGLADSLKTCGQLQYDTTTGSFSFKPTFACVPAGDSNYTRELVFRARDRGNPALTATLTARITVFDLNTAPRWKNVQPTVTGKEGRSISLNLDSLFLGDDEGDSVAFSTSLGAVTKNPLAWSWVPGFGDSGQKTVTVTAQDNHRPPLSGNLSIRVTVQDSTRPVDVVINYPPNGFVTRDNLIPVKWAVNGQNQNTQTAEQLQNEGANPVVRSAQDGQGNTGRDSIIVLRDQTPPQKPVMRGPGLTNNTKPHWSWSGGGGGVGYFRYKLDAQNFTDTMGVGDTAFTPSSALSEGRHVHYVEERDAAGNWSAPESNVVVLDLTVPSVKITSPLNNAVLRQSSVDVQWTVDGRPQAPITKPLNPGSNLLGVSYSDSAGNTGRDSITVTRDTAANSKPIVTGPGLTNNRRPTWRWSTGGGTGYYRFRLDNPDLTSDPAGVTDNSFAPTTDLSDGRHVLYIQERNLAGGWSDIDSSGIADVDATPPKVKITAPISGFLTNGDSVTVAWTVDGAAQNIRTTENLKSKQGPIVILRDSTDPAGNRGFDSVTIRRDTVPPLRPIFTASSTPTPTNQTRPIWVWKSGGGGMGTFRYSFQNQAAVTVTDTLYQPLSALGDSTYSLTVAERDSAGNWGPSETRLVRVQTTGPVVKIKSPTPGTQTNQNSIAVAWTVNNVDQTGQTTEDLTGKTGTVYILRTAIDSASNTGRDSVSIVVDRTPPGTPTVTTPTTPTRQKRPSWSWIPGGGGGAGFQYQLDGGAVTNIAASPFSPLSDLSDASHTFVVRELDAAGNASPYSSVSTVVVKANPPAAPTVRINTTPTNAPAWNWTTNGGGNGTFQYKLGANGALSTTTATSYAPTLGNGIDTLFVAERDVVGYGAFGSAALTVDTTAPQLAITAPSVPNSITSVNPVISGTASDNLGLQSVTYTINGSGGGSILVTSGTWSIWPSENDGINTVTVKATDVAGNTASRSITIYKYSNVVFVRQGATGSRNGTSWENAYTDLYPVAEGSYPAGTQIWVAAGSYAADPASGEFVIKSPDLSLYGGFAANGTAPRLADRGFDANKTELTGTSSRAIVYAADINSTTGVINKFVLDGFTATSSSGGVVRDAISGNAQILNCRFSGYNASAISVALGNVIIANSNLTFGGPGFGMAEGGAIAAYSPAVVSVSNCSILNNRTDSQGIAGGITVVGATMTVQNCVVRGNTDAGNIPLQISVHTPNSVLHVGNTALDGGFGDITNPGGGQVIDDGGNTP